jgi:Peptidase family M1 domain
MIPSLFMRGRTYQNAAYSKPSIVYQLLRKIMGDEKFKNALHLYINRWNGKHPTPYDFFYTFDEVNGENLNWFWIPWFFEQGYADLAIKAVNTLDARTEVVIEKIGNLPVPIKAKIVYIDDSEGIIMYPASVWKENTIEYRFIFSPELEIVRIEIGDEYIPDINQENNFYQINK